MAGAPYIPDLRAGPFVLLDDSRPSHKAGRSLLFTQPEKIIIAQTLEDVGQAIADIDACYQAGLHLAGWIAYECAGYFEPRLASYLSIRADEPLIWMMATQHRQTLTQARVREALHHAQRGSFRKAGVTFNEPDVGESDYREALDAVHRYINAGDVYQINFTFEMPGQVSGDTLSLYDQLRRSQPVPYGAYIQTAAPEGHRVLSLSPELFMKRSGETLTTRPMKGTAPRATTLAADDAVMDSLARDPKSRAENLMIVDLIRNDLSRISKPGTVEVPDLFSVERYKSLHQMTSGVQSTVDEELLPGEMLRAIFPCGSVTGAPKIRAMEIIAELEKQPRGVYCGAIGYFSPPSPNSSSEWVLNVPIRTLSVQEDGACRLNVGSGVVADSDTQGEYEECLLKAAFATTAAPDDFSLLETFALTDDGIYPNLDDHLARMAESAAYFDYPFDGEAARAHLSDHADAATATHGSKRTRLLLDANGHFTVTSLPLSAEAAGGARVCFASETLQSTDPFLFHKTTHRPLYDSAYTRAHKSGFADMLFFNERGELCEGAISTVFIEKDGKWFTPALACGLLPGVLRTKLLRFGAPETGEQPVKEAVIRLEDLDDADTLWIGNSLRGLRKVDLERIWR